MLTGRLYFFAFSIVLFSQSNSTPIDLLIKLSTSSSVNSFPAHHSSIYSTDSLPLIKLSVQYDEYYRDMIYAYEDGRKNIYTPLFNTLYQSGYLKNTRDEKITELLNGDNSINS